MKIPFYVIGILLITQSCGSQRHTAFAEYRKYATGASGEKGVIFQFTILQANQLGDLQSVYVNNEFVQYSTKEKGDTLYIEANKHYAREERVFDPEYPNQKLKDYTSPLHDAQKYAGYITFLKDEKLDSLHIRNFKAANRNAEAGEIE